VKLIVDHYNKKDYEEKLIVEDMILKIAGGEEIPDDAHMRQYMGRADTFYLLPRDPSKRRKIIETEGSPPVVTATPKPTEKSAARKDGKLRCKRFGCNTYFSEDDNNETCYHHTMAPVFHDTAKYWLCCPNKKTYDWDNFQRIPPCSTSQGHSAETEKGPAVMGGSELRNANRPQQLEGPTDPKKHIDNLRKTLTDMGGSEDIFDKAWGKLAVKTGGNSGKIVEELVEIIQDALQQATN